MALLRCASKFDPFLSLDCAPRPQPWRNPRKGRDQILPTGNLSFTDPNSIAATSSPPDRPRSTAGAACPAASRTSGSSCPAADRTPRSSPVCRPSRPRQLQVTPPAGPRRPSGSAGTAAAAAPPGTIRSPRRDRPLCSVPIASYVLNQRCRGAISFVYILVVLLFIFTVTNGTCCINPLQPAAASEKSNKPQ